MPEIWKADFTIDAPNATVAMKLANKRTGGAKRSGVVVHKVKRRYTSGQYKSGKYKGRPMYNYDVYLRYSKKLQKSMKKK